MKRMVFDTDWLEDDEFSLDDERENLGTKSVGTVLVIAELSLWNGKCPGYRFLEGSGPLDRVFNVFQGDPFSLYVEDGDLKGDDIHHDGTNRYAFYEVADREAADESAGLVYAKKDLPKKLFRTALRPLGSTVSDIYGFKD